MRLRSSSESGGDMCLGSWMFLRLEQDKDQASKVPAANTKEGTSYNDKKVESDSEWEDGKT